MMAKEEMEQRLGSAGLGKMSGGSGGEIQRGTMRGPVRGGDGHAHARGIEIARGGTSIGIMDGRGRDQKIGESDREVETGKGETTGRDETETTATAGEIDLETTAVDEAEADRARHIAGMATLLSDESNTRTSKLHDFFETRRPKYAMLFHT